MRSLIQKPSLSQQVVSENAWRDNILDRKFPVVGVHGVVDPVKVDNIVLGVRNIRRERLVPAY